jgi:hypothetical protein
MYPLLAAEVQGVAGIEVHTKNNTFSGWKQNLKKKHTNKKTLRLCHENWLHTIFLGWKCYGQEKEEKLEREINQTLSWKKLCLHTGSDVHGVPLS